MNGNRKTLPDAFDKKKGFPAIIKDDELMTPISRIRPAEHYRMGQLRITYAFATGGYPELLSVSHPSRYPTWDEMVWIRYKLCSPDADMAMLLPSLEYYINYDSGYGQNTFTMEAVDRTKTHQVKE